MADDHIPDLILNNILAQLQAKSLLRFKCVSKHWYHLITDPYFMLSRSQRRIFLTMGTLHLIVDDNVTSDMSQSALEVSYPFEHLMINNRRVTIVGTFNGLVLLYYVPYVKNFTCQMILYNPFTRAYKKLPNPSHSAFGTHYCAYGFGYGTTPDDLKIVMFEESKPIFHYSTPFVNACEVFNLKTSLWSSFEVNNKYIRFEEPLGTYVNGFLYWISYAKDMLIVFNVKEIELSGIHLPFQRSYECTYLGSIHGCLCLLNLNFQETKFDLWVMREQGVEDSWFITCSFTFSSDPTSFGMSNRPIWILDNGRILMMNRNHQLLIYDIWNKSYKMLNVLLSPDDIKAVHGIEYMESQVSPLEF